MKRFLCSLILEKFEDLFDQFVLFVLEKGCVSVNLGRKVNEF